MFHTRRIPAESVGASVETSSSDGFHCLFLFWDSWREEAQNSGEAGLPPLTPVPNWSKWIKSRMQETVRGIACLVSFFFFFALDKTSNKAFYFNEISVPSCFSSLAYLMPWMFHHQNQQGSVGHDYVMRIYSCQQKTPCQHTHTHPLPVCTWFSLLLMVQGSFFHCTALLQQRKRSDPENQDRRSLCSLRTVTS